MKVKTVADVERLVAGIRRIRGDCEGAHVQEDALFHLTLQAIAAGADRPEELATAALESLEIQFPRYCS